MVVFIFLVIYRPAILPGIAITDVLLLIAFIGSILNCGGKIGLKQYIPDRNILICICLVLAAAFYSSIISFAAGQGMFYGNIYIKMMLYNVVYASYICSTARKRGYDAIRVLDWALWASALQSIFVVIMLLDSGIKFQVITQLIDNGALGITYQRLTTYTQRTFGLADGYFSGLGIVSGLMAALCVMLGMQKTKYFLFLPGLLLTALVNVRTGLVIFAVCLCVLFFMSGNISNKKKLRFIGILLVAVFVCLLGLQVIKTAAPATYEWLEDISVHVGNLFADEEESGRGTYYKLNPLNWELPGWIGTIFGTGLSYFGAEGLKNFGRSSDSGYLNLIYQGGLILSALLYCFVYKLCFPKKFRVDAVYRKLSAIMVVTLLIQQYKGGIFYFNEYMTLIIILCISVYSLGIAGDNVRQGKRVI